MARPSTRERILTEGLRVVHEQGFAGASVRDIVRAAGVPQGSFTNHFASKEAFGQEVIERYFAGSREVMRATLRNEGLPPLERLAAYIDSFKDRSSRNGMRHGCLIGNFAAEASCHSEAIRARLVAIFGEVQEKSQVACRQPWRTAASRRASIATSSRRSWSRRCRARIC